MIEVPVADVIINLMEEDPSDVLVIIDGEKYKSEVSAVLLSAVFTA
jgi:hypothetical protein